MADAKSHDRGSFIHPEDGKEYRYPDSLESAHHISHDGSVVHSPAQKKAISTADDTLAQCAETNASATEVPLFLNHVLPVSECQMKAVEEELHSEPEVEPDDSEPADADPESD